MGSDFEALARLPDGEIEFDLRRGRASFEGVPLELWVAGELKAWLEWRLEELGLAADVFDSAVMLAALRKEGQRVVVLRWDIRTELRSGPDVYRSRRTDVHRWHRAAGA